MIIKSPFGRRRYIVQPYDKKDFILPNSKTKRRSSRNVLNLSAMTSKGWNHEIYNVRKDEYRDWALDDEYIKKSAQKEKERLKPKKLFKT
jgi:hypothetical protein